MTATTRNMASPLKELIDCCCTECDGMEPMVL